MQANLLQRDRLTVRELGHLTGIDPSSLGKSFKSASAPKRRELAKHLIACGHNATAVSRWGKAGVPIQGAINVLGYYLQSSNPQKRNRAAESLKQITAEVEVEKNFKSTSSLERATVKHLQSEFSINPEGRATVSIRGAARLAGVSAGGLSESLSSAGDRLKATSLVKFLLNQGLEGVQHWVAQGIPDAGLALILEYYAYECRIQYQTQQAKLCCRAFRAIGIRTWIQSELGWQKPEPKPKPVKHLPPTPDEIASVFDITLGKASLPAELVAGVKLNAIAASHPHLRETCEEGRRVLAEHSVIPEPLLTPTAIGEKLGMSAQAVNRALVDLGYQIKNRFARSQGHRSEAAYIPTDKGREYCSFTLATARDNTTYQHLKWHQSIIKELQYSTQDFWDYVLENIPHRATRELLRQQGRLLEVRDRTARMGISSGLVRVTTSKLETIESAFAAALGRSVTVKIEAIG